MIISISVLFAIYALHSYISYDFAIREVKSSAALRNEAQALNIMRDLDIYIDKRIDNFEDLSRIEQIRQAVLASNRDHLLGAIVQGLPSGGMADVPYQHRMVYESIFEELRYLVEFYKKEYNYDVINELFITNQDGAHIISNMDDLDARHDDQMWWTTASAKRIYIGEFEYNEKHGTHSLVVAYPILDDAGSFIGAMRVAVSIDDLLHDFLIDADILSESKKNVMLLDSAGQVIYEKDRYYPNKAAPYFDRLEGGSGTIEYSDNGVAKMVSYASSVGYKDFTGFDWTVVIERDEAVILSDFVDLRNNVIISTTILMVSAVALSLILSHFVTKPLGQISKLTGRLGKGDFDTKLRQSKINEINTIADSFNTMEVSLKKLLQTEKELAEANARIKNERLTAIGELAASMAHDMKNPLGTIKSGIDIMKRHGKADNPELAEVMQRVNRAIMRMSHQVEDVLNYVRFTPLDVKPASIRSIIQSAVRSIEVPKAVAVQVQGEDAELQCDEKKLEIVFINLILNAIQAIGDGPGSVTIRTRADAGNVAVEIEDSGPGIPDEVVSEIFKPLVTTKLKGTGLGLASCKNIITQHGGKISFTNNPTVFTVILPKKQE